MMLIVIAQSVSEFTHWPLEEIVVPHVVITSVFYPGLSSYIYTPLLPDVIQLKPEQLSFIFWSRILRIEDKYY